MLFYSHRPTRSANPRHAQAPPAIPPRRPPAAPAMWRATAERKLRILERLTSGASIAHVAHAENLTTRRAPQFTAEILPTRDVDPPAGFVPLQIARLGAAMRIAHTKTREGDLQAKDRVVKLVGERDAITASAGLRLSRDARSPQQRNKTPAKRLKRRNSAKPTIAPRLRHDGARGRKRSDPFRFPFASFRLASPHRRGEAAANGQSTAQPPQGGLTAGSRCGRQPKMCEYGGVRERGQE